MARDKGSGHKQKTAAILLGAILFMNCASAKATAVDMPSPWAEKEVERAVRLGFIPGDLNNAYQQPITRGEFATLSLRFLASMYNYSIRRNPEAWMGDFMNDYCTHRTDRDGLPFWEGDFIEDYDETVSYGGNFWSSGPVNLRPFSDVAEDNPRYIDIASAYLFGLINGRGNGCYEPQGEITRQEAASLLARLYVICGGTTADITSANFSDEDEIASWALNCVETMCEMEVMEGTGNNRFNPADVYTREQAYISLLRLYENAPVSWINGNLTPIVSYEEALSNILSSGFGTLLDVTRWETPLGTILAGNMNHRHSAGDYGLYVIYYAGGWVNLLDFLPVSYGGNQHPAEDISFSEDKNTIFLPLPLTKRKCRCLETPGAIIIREI